MNKLTLKTKFQGLKIFCNACKKPMEAMCPKHSIDRQCYKITVYVPGTENKRTKSLVARTEEEAIIEAIAFKQEVINGSAEKVEPNPAPVVLNMPVAPVIPPQAEPKPLTLGEAITIYLKFLNNEGVPIHKQKQRTQKHIGETQQALQFMGTAVSLDLSIYELTEEHAGLVFNAVINKQGKKGDRIKARTFNYYITAYRTLFEYLIGKGYAVQNHFKEIELRKAQSKPQMITLKEFYAVIARIETGSPVKEYTYLTQQGSVRVEKKNLYRYWLKDAILLALYGGGRRREEIAVLKWPAIHVNNETGGLLGGIVSYRNLKVERQKNIIFEDEQMPVEVPITPQLADLLIELGWNEHKGKDQYVIAPEIKNRETLMKDITRGFSHYYSQIENPREDISFRNIRKTYITYTRALLAGRAKEITGHATDKVIENHYEDTQLIRQRVVEELKF